MSAIWTPVYNDGSYASAWPPHQRYLAGPSSGYTSPPTLAQVNAGSGHNQIVAEARRWFAMLNLQPPGNLAYVPAGQRQSVIALHDAIVSLNAVMYRSGPGFSNSMQPGTRARLVDIKQLRQALDNPPKNPATLTPNTNSRSLRRTDKPSWDTQYGNITAGSSATPQLGINSGGASTWLRYRAYLSFSVPLMTGQPLTSASLSVTMNRSTIIDSNVEIRLQPTADSPAVAADWATAVNGTLIGTITPALSGQPQTFYINPSLLVPGRDNSFALVTDLDRIDSFPYQYTSATVDTGFIGGTSIPVVSQTGGSFMPSLWSPSRAYDVSAAWYELEGQSMELLAVASNVLTVSPAAQFTGHSGYGVSISQAQASLWSTTAWQLNLTY